MFNCVLNSALWDNIYLAYKKKRNLDQIAFFDICFGACKMTSPNFDVDKNKIILKTI